MSFPVPRQDADRDDTLYLLAFNPTRLDMDKSRSFGIAIRNRPIVLEASKLFEADTTRQPYTPGCDRFVVSPETSRKRLTDFIGKAKKQLLIYDLKVSDPRILRLLNERSKAGVEIRVIGHVAKRGAGLRASKLRGMRLHARAIIRDGRHVFLGSQSLRKLELDGRREVGVIVDDKGVVRRMLEIFESDWAGTSAGEAAKAEEERKTKERMASGRRSSRTRRIRRKG
jgi:phosphatidylserine/phosphatidylglycerophosphate/cardiolipin synthase-like enzyme